jgi:mRNA interferase RelE/StbE
MYILGVAAGYSIEFDTTAVKALRKIERPFQVRIAAAITALATDPRPDGCKKMTGSKDGYRIRIGDYRVIYTINDGVRIVKIQKIGHRKEVYR